jgi:hypothetical protein
MTGTPILMNDEFGVRVPTDAIDPEQAMAVVMRAYLEGLEFAINGNGGTTPVPSTQFRFEAVLDEWPDPGSQPPYPCATLSMSEVPILAHKLGGPSALEDTWGRYDCEDKGIAGTCLWKLGEADATMQIDVWATNVAQREAILARLVSAFSPGEATSRLMLTGTPMYYCLPVRAQLLGYRRVDETDPVWANERRAIVSVNVNIDSVELRCATMLQPIVSLVAIGPTEELVPEQE